MRIRTHCVTTRPTSSAPESTVTVTNVRFYLFVNQVTNAVPFAVSSGVVDVGVRRGVDGLVFTSMNVILDADDSVPFAEYSTASAAAGS